MFADVADKPPTTGALAFRAGHDSGFQLAGDTSKISRIA
jgi:hypothetical protein